MKLAFVYHASAWTLLEWFEHPANSGCDEKLMECSKSYSSCRKDKMKSRSVDAHPPWRSQERASAGVSKGCQKESAGVSIYFTARIFKTDPQLKLRWQMLYKKNLKKWTQHLDPYRSLSPNSLVSSAKKHWQCMSMTYNISYTTSLLIIGSIDSDMIHGP